ncbi:MAG: histidine kinase dimerization/phospho-acceptor domain-containing protein [Planctomycetaceae bacterium]
MVTTSEIVLVKTEPGGAICRALFFGCGCGSECGWQRFVWGVIVMDESRERERELLRAQNTELATLAGGLAHEIRNPLSTIGMNLELLAEDLGEDDSPRGRRMLRRIGSCPTALYVDRLTAYACIVCIIFRIAICMVMHAMLIIT